MISLSIQSNLISNHETKPFLLINILDDCSSPILTLFLPRHVLTCALLQDPLSHRIIEKRRRDRMNNCLADLSRLIPSSYLKKGRGRIEKTEIIEMAIKHIRHLQSHPCTKQEGCELAHEIESGLSKVSFCRNISAEIFSYLFRNIFISIYKYFLYRLFYVLLQASSVESFRVGYHECLTETMHFLVEKEGLYAGNSFCVRLMSHLQKHFDKLGRGL